MNKFALILSLSFLIIGCTDSSDEDLIIRQQVSCSIEFGVNLPATATALNTEQFDPFSPATYTAASSINFFDISGNTLVLTAHYLKSDQQDNSWDVYFSYDELPINIVSGASGGNSQLKAQLTFDDSGALISTQPETLASEQLIFDDELYSHTINFIFSDTETTQLDAPYSPTFFGNTCVIE